MARVKTFVNGGSLLPSDLNSIQDEYEFAFSTYKTIRDRGARLDAASAGTYLLRGNDAEAVAAAGALAGLAVFYLDPADRTANTRANKLRVRGACLVNATAPTVNFTFGLYPVSAVAGAAATVSVTLGTVVTGSTVTFSAPGASSRNQDNSGDFAAPAAGYYALGCVVSGAMAANSAVAVRAELQYRQV